MVQNEIVLLSSTCPASLPTHPGLTWENHYYVLTAYGKGWPRPAVGGRRWGVHLPSSLAVAASLLRRPPQGAGIVRAGRPTWGLTASLCSLPATPPPHLPLGSQALLCLCPQPFCVGRPQDMWLGFHTMSTGPVPVRTGDPGTLAICRCPRVLGKGLGGTGTEASFLPFPGAGHPNLASCPFLSSGAHQQPSPTRAL